MLGVMQGTITDNSFDRLAYVRDPGLLRPYIEDSPEPMFDRYRGRPCVTINSGFRHDGTPIYRQYLISELQARGVNSPVFNATSLRKLQWVKLDQELVREARFRLKAFQDLRDANSYGGFNGMGTMRLEYEKINDVGEAVVDMDGVTAGRASNPQFQLEGLPLPITHMDFHYTARQMAVSKNNGGQGFDSITGEMSGRRVAESIERQTIGVETGISQGGTGELSGGGAYSRTSSIYGYLNFPQRLTKTNLYKPTGVGRAGTGWVPLDTVKDVLAMLDSLYLNKFYGPFMLYHGNDWTQYMDADYILTGGNVATQTLRERLKKIEGIQDVRRLDFLTASALTQASDVAGPTSANPWTLILVQMTKDVARAVIGLDLTTVQWEEVGGMMLKFKVMAIMVPQLRDTYAGNCGILHANASAGV